MNDAKTYPRPDGKMPRSNQRCDLCGVAPGVAHKATCPWKLWADSPQQEAGRG